MPPIRSVRQKCALTALAALLGVLSPGCASGPGTLLPESEPPPRPSLRFDDRPPDAAPMPAVRNVAAAPAAASEQATDNDGASPKPKIELRGRIHADALFVSQSTRDQAIIGDLENAVGFRRARLGAQGWIGEQVRWVSEFDFAGGNIVFRDVYVALEDLPIVRQVRVGNFSEPFSLEGEMSSNGLTFVERSPANAIDPDRHWGVGIFTYTDNERATFAGGAFRSGTNSSGNVSSDQNDMAYTFRVTGLPWHPEDAEGRRLMHLGAAFSQRFPLNNVVTFNQGPRNSLLQFATDDPLTPFVPDISIPASQYQLYNLQWATVLGPLSFQAEWYGTTIDQIGGGEVFLHGSYAYVSYFLTGEHRAYDRNEGAFGLINVLRPFVRLRGNHLAARGPGAWELTARFAYLDFSDSNLPLTSTGLKQGNRDAETTFGLNWYLNNNARFMFNYIHVIPVDPNFGPSAADAFFFRTEVFW